MDTMNNPEGKLDIGALLSRSVEIYKASFATFWLAVLALIVPGFVLIIAGALLESGFGAFLAFVGVALTVLALLVFVGVIVKIVQDVESDGRVNKGLAELFSEAAPMIGRLLILFVASYAAIFAGYIFLIIPGIIVALKLAVSVPALFVEERHVFATMARSAQLTRGNLWRILGVLVLISLALLLIQLAVSVFSALSAVVGGVIGLVMAIAVYPYLGIIYSILYFELRVVKEGFEPQVGSGPAFVSPGNGDPSLGAGGDSLSGSRESSGAQEVPPEG